MQNGPNFCIIIPAGRPERATPGFSHRKSSFPAGEADREGSTLISVAIAEDEDIFATTITSYLKRFAKENGEQIRITRFTDGYAVVDGYRGGFDIILMDIEMGLMNGMEAAEHIRKVDDEVTIIFITNMAQYAIKGYAVQAMDYILKPVTYTAFAETLKKAVGRLQRKQENYISVSYRDGMVKLRSSDITFVESQGHRLTFHTETDSYETTVYTMKDVEERLRPSGFLRASSGTLVNLNRVTGTKNGFVRVGEQYLPISRGRKNEFMAALVSNMVE